MCEHTFVPEYRYTVTDYDPDQPWIVLGTSHGKVTLPDAESFYRWAHEHWPAPRWRVELDLWQLSSG